MESNDPSRLQERIKALEKENEQLKQSCQLHKKIVDKLPLGIQVFDREGFSYEINPAQKELLGLSSMEEGIGQFNVLTDPYSRAMGADKKYEKVYSGETYGHEFEYDLGARENNWNTREDKRIFHEKIFPITDEKGKVEFTVAVLEDKTEERKAEQALKESEERHRMTLRSMGDAVISTDTSGKVLQMNPIAEEMTGWSMEEAKYNPICEVFNLINSKTGEKADCPVDQVLESKDVVELSNHTKLISKDNNEYHIADSAAPIKDDRDNIHGAVAVFRDVTEEYHKNQQIKKYKDLLARSQQIAHIGSWKLDLTENRLTWSDEVYRIFGLEPQEFGATYEAFLDAVHPEDRNAVSEAYEGSIRDGLDGYDIEHRIIREHTGEIRYVHERCEHIKSHSGKMIRSIGMIQDITERKKAEKSLAKEAEDQRILLDNIPIHVWYLKNETAYGFVNKAHADFFGVSKEHFSYKDIYEIFPKEVADTCKEGNRHVFDDKMTIKTQQWVQNASGEKRLLAISKTPKLNQEGDVEYVVCAAEDITERKRAKQELIKAKENARENEAMLKAAMENSQAGIAIVDVPTGKLRFVNESGLKILNQDYQSLTKDNINAHKYGELWKVLHFDGIPYQNDEIPLVRATLYGESCRRELIIRHENNQDRYVLVNAAPVKDENKKQVAAIAVMIDITDKTKTEIDLQSKNKELEATKKELKTSNQDLKESNQLLENQKDELVQYKRMVEGSEDMMAAVDRNYRYLCVNRAFLNYHQLSEEEVVGYKAGEVLGEQAFKEKIKPYLDKSIHGESVQFDMVKDYPEYGKVYLDINYYPLEKDEGIGGVAAVMRDITQRKKAEQSLEESEEKHRFLFENMTQGVVYHKSNGEIFYANPSAANILGLTFDELCGRTNVDPRWKTIHEDGSDFPGETHPAMVTLKTGKPVYSKKMGVFNPQKNDYNWININSIPKFRKNQSLPYQVVVIFEDITEREQTKEELRKAKEKAEESDRLKSAFLANMSHEIRTPMNGIMGFSEMLQEKEFPKKKRDQFLNIIHTRTNHLLNIINDLVDVSKIEANQLALNHQDFCMNDVLKELYRVYNNELQVKEKTHIQLKVKKALDDRNSCISSDPSRFRQIMDNLLNNAIKFSHEGNIEFGYELQSDDQLLFFVRDTGIGISHDQQEHIFERFRQADDTSSRAYEGTGLGLTISKNLVELMGGQMWLNSKEDEGSVFYFTLPYRTQQKTGKEETKKAEADKPEGESKTLLIIEDDPTSLEYLKELLKPSGFNTITCATGKEGYEAFLNHPEIDLILMDIKLPDTTGLELTKKIRASADHNDVPIIAQTAYAMSEDAQKSIDAGCDDYISKPIDKRKLLAKMHKFF